MSTLHTDPSSLSPSDELSSTAAPAATLSRVIDLESLAIYLALGAGVLGGLAGLVIAIAFPPLPLQGDSSFGTLIAILAGVIAGVVGSFGYWRARKAPEQEWRLALSTLTFTINTVAVVLVHTALAILVTLVIFLVLSRGFIGLEVEPFWACVLGAATLGLSAYLTFLSVSRMSTQRMSSLLMTFVATGTITAMVITPDPIWWETHFSHLGTFWNISSFVFNGTLIVGGLLVVAFAVYLANDLRKLVVQGVLKRRSSPTVISIMFIVMGAMLAGVGLFPVNFSLLLHNVSASGMAVMYGGLLIAGPWILAGLPRAYFVAAWAFLAGTVLSTALFIVGYFGLTAFEIVVFALIFGWISVFIRFLGVADRR